MSEAYSNPKYYEIAFSFRDIAAEVDVLEQAIEQFSQIPVATVLELGCGPAPHLTELARRGYRYIGLDLSNAMLEFAQSRASTVNASAKYVLADMMDFRLDDQVDFAYLLLGSLEARSTAELGSHFDCVGRALKAGGLYFLDWCVVFAPSKERTESWEMIQGEVIVKTTVQQHLIDPVEQLVEESVTLEVEDQGAKKVFQSMYVVRQIYPQEFLLFSAARSDFEFVGWWNNWDMTQPLDGKQEISRPVTILRKV
ncbi:MAG: class I SAM-dependent methyltransferase [Anaerolineae bacterium]